MYKLSWKSVRAKHSKMVQNFSNVDHLRVPHIRRWPTVYLGQFSTNIAVIMVFKSLFGSYDYKLHVSNIHLHRKHRDFQREWCCPNRTIWLDFQIQISDFLILRPSKIVRSSSTQISFPLHQYPKILPRFFMAAVFL
jgi:hypothetical protein